MNISMYTVYARNLSFDSPLHAFEHFYAQGVRYGVILDDEFVDLPLHLYCDYLKAAGIFPETLVSTLNIAHANSNIRLKNLAIIKGYIDSMQQLGIPEIMLAPAVSSARNSLEWDTMQTLLINSLKEIVSYAKTFNITVSIENQSSFQRPDSRITDIRFILDSIPDLKFVLDSGNFYCIGEDVIRAYNLLQDRTIQVHAKDWKIDPFGSIVKENLPRLNGTILGQGILPLADLIKKLKGKKYSGNFVLEINANSITKEMLDESVVFLKSQI